MKPESPLPLSEACERNKGPILSLLEAVFETSSRVLEIGSGTGQHAAYFAEHLPHLEWQCSELPDRIEMLAERITRSQLDNLPAPLAFEVQSPLWPIESADAVFSANTAHILSWNDVEYMFAGIGQILEPGGAFVLYGPFASAGRHCSTSNARFDEFLKQRDPLSGIRDIADLRVLAERCGMRLEDERAMPANNQILVWRRQSRDTDGDRQLSTDDANGC